MRSARSTLTPSIVTLFRTGRDIFPTLRYWDGSSVGRILGNSGYFGLIYASTLLFWLRDHSDEDEATLSFLDRRLADVGKIGGARRAVEERVRGIGERLRGFIPRRA